MPPIKKSAQVYEQSLNALAAANMHKYVDSQNPVDVLQKLLNVPRLDTIDEKKQNQIIKDFFTLVANLFQSITTRGLFTYEIFDYIVKKIEHIVQKELKLSPEAQKKQGKLLGALIADYVCIFHKDYYFDSKAIEHFKLEEGNKDTLRGAISREVFKSLFHFNQGINSTSELDSKNESRYGTPYAGDLKDSDVIVGRPHLRVLPNVACFLNLEKTTKNNLEQKVSEINVNKNIENPTKSEPSLSVILLNNRNIRCGTKNSLELSAFFNSISNLEFSKAFPYFNVTFILPNTSKQDITNVFKTATLNQFMFGSRTEGVTGNYNKFEGKIVERNDRIGVTTNLSVFATPQTAINMNEKVGHRDIYNESDKKLRLTSVHNKTSPFMTLKSFEIDIAPTTGLMSFKSGRISMVLHDRTRMGDIAPFIKPDLFGAFGAEISVEYGWTHQDAGKLNAQNSPINPIGDFLNSSVCLEKYMITNSQFSITASGEVEINLSIAMKGPIDLRQTEVVEFTRISIQRNAFDAAQQRYLRAVGDLQEELGTNRTTPSYDRTITASANGFNNSFTGRYTEKYNKPKKGKKKKTFTEEYKRAQGAINKLSLISKALLSIEEVAFSGTSQSFQLDRKKFTNNKRLRDKKAYIVDIRDIAGLGDRLSEKGVITAAKTVQRADLDEKIQALQQRADILRNAGKDADAFEVNAQIQTLNQQALNSVSSISRDTIISLGNAISNLSIQLQKIIDDNDKLKKQIQSYINNLIGGLQITDLFYDGSLGNAYESIPSLRSISFEPKDYITFGSFLVSLASSHMITLQKYDEIQFVFHNVNEKAGLCSSFGAPSQNLLQTQNQQQVTDEEARSQGLSIASLLLEKQRLEIYLQDLFEKNAKITVESLISQIITNFVVTKDNPCYGLQDFFERKDFKSPVKPKKEKKDAKISSNASMTLRLNEFYYGNKKNAKVLYDSEGVFVPPTIQLSFDALSDVTNLDKTILRISVYDRNDNPYQSISNCFNQGDDISHKGIKQLLRTAKELENNKKRKDILKGKKKRTKSQKAELNTLNSIIDDQTKVSKKLYGKVIGKDGIFERVTIGDKELFRFKSGKGFLDIKKRTRSLMPTATFASEHSALISASAATVNEAKLNTVYITNQNRNNTAELNGNVIVDMPLRVLPSQVSIETFGCPWASFGQYIFVDFETGTTLDNSYAVTSIKHTLTPGNFKTSLSLSYGDVFGKYEGLADGFNNLIAGKFDSLADESIEVEELKDQTKNQKAAEETEAESQALKNPVSKNNPSAGQPKTITPSRASPKDKANFKKAKKVEKKLKRSTKPTASVKKTKTTKNIQVLDVTKGVYTLQKIFNVNSVESAIQFSDRYNICVYGSSENHIFDIYKNPYLKIKKDIENLKKIIDKFKSTTGFESVQIRERISHAIHLSFDSNYDRNYKEIISKILTLTRESSERLRELIKIFHNIKDFFTKQHIFDFVYLNDDSLESDRQIAAYSINTNPKTFEEAISRHIIKTKGNNISNVLLRLGVITSSLHKTIDFDSFYRILSVKEKIQPTPYKTIIPDVVKQTKDFYSIFGIVVHNKTLDHAYFYYVKIPNLGLIYELTLKAGTNEFSISEIERLFPNAPFEFVQNLKKTYLNSSNLPLKSYIQTQSIKDEDILSEAFLISDATGKNTNVFLDDGFVLPDNLEPEKEFDYEFYINNVFNSTESKLFAKYSDDKKKFYNKKSIAHTLNDFIKSDELALHLYELNLDKAKFINNISKNISLDNETYVDPFEIEIENFYFPGKNASFQNKKNRRDSDYDDSISSLSNKFSLSDTFYRGYNLTGSHKLVFLFKAEYYKDKADQTRWDNQVGNFNFFRCYYTIFIIIVEYFNINRGEASLDDDEILPQLKKDEYVVLNEKINASHALYIYNILLEKFKSRIDFGSSSEDEDENKLKKQTQLAVKIFKEVCFFTDDKKYSSAPFENVYSLIETPPENL